MRIRPAGIVLLMAGVCGCSARGNVDLLESRLRQQEDKLFQTGAELESARSDLTVARREVDALRMQLVSRGDATILPERADALFRAEGIRFNTLQTGGLDRDNQRGDDSLSAVLVPHDVDGDLVKLSGRIQLELFDLALPGDRQRIGSWDFDATQSSNHWHRGFVGTGYLFQLPWQKVPEHSELLLHARLTAADGREFNTSKSIAVTPPVPVDRVANDAPPQLIESSGDRQEIPVWDSSPTLLKGPDLFRRLGGEQQDPRVFDLPPVGSGDRKVEPVLPK